MALVELLLPPLPAHVRTARLVVTAAARRAGLVDELVDELRLAIGEACGRAVLLHARHAPGAVVTITVKDDPTGLTVAVRDRGPASGRSSADGPDAVAGLLDDETDAAGDRDDDAIGDPDVALAVVQGLVDDVSVEPDADGNTVTMRWPLPPRLAPLPSTAAVED